MAADSSDERKVSRSCVLKCLAAAAFAAAGAVAVAVASGSLPRRERYVRILHQQYWTADQAEWPPEWRALSALWRERHPDWEYRFWTDESEARLFIEELPEFLELYRDLPACRGAPIARADLATYAILYLHGGVYADMDTAPLANLDEVLGALVHEDDPRPAIIVNIARPEEGTDEVRGNGGLEDPFSTDNDLMISAAPRHRFFYEVLASIDRFVKAQRGVLCETLRTTPTYDLMFLTAWGRLEICARAWGASGMDRAGLEFLEAMYLLDREDGSVAHAVMHALPNLTLQELQAQPPPRRERLFDAWLDKALRKQRRRRGNASYPAVRRLPLPQQRYGALDALVQAPDLLILPIAASPSTLTKAALRQLVINCTSLHGAGREFLPCFHGALEAPLKDEFPQRNPQHNLLVVFNQDGGVWEGSWDEEQQALYAQAAAGSGSGAPTRTDL